MENLGNNESLPAWRLFFGEILTALQGTSRQQADRVKGFEGRLGSKIGAPALHSFKRTEHEDAVDASRNDGETELILRSGQCPPCTPAKTLVYRASQCSRRIRRGERHVSLAGRHIHEHGHGPGVTIRRAD